MSVAKEQTNFDAPKTCVQNEWTQVLCPTEPIDGELELEWLELALKGQSTAALWIGKQGLVAPMSYQHHTNLIEVCTEFAIRGWPVRLRRSGGGVVPQGPGILNLSLAKPCQGAPGDLAESIYADLCQLLAGALAGLGIKAEARAVSGSFCDGRFNLAVIGNDDQTTRKIAGTAQYWRHAESRHAVLAHALLIVDADPAALTAEANRFETALVSGRHYERNSLTSVSQAWCAAHPGKEIPFSLLTDLKRQIIAELTTRYPTGDFHVTA